MKSPNEVEQSFRGTSPIRNSAPLGPYSRTMPRALWKPEGGGLFLMSEVPLELLSKGVPPRSTGKQRDVSGVIALGVATHDCWAEWPIAGMAEISHSLSS